MKKKIVFFALFVISSISAANLCSAGEVSSQELANLMLKREYDYSCQNPSDINEHVPHLRRLAKEVSSVTELGLRSMVSSWGILMGLAESPYDNKRYVGIDMNYPPEERLNLGKDLAEANGIDFHFIEANDLHIDIEPTDMLFIDTLHTYAQLTYELETFSPKALKYIAMHDTSGAYDVYDCLSYKGDFSEYPAFVDRNKRGMWVAVLDFLGRHPEWSLQERYLNNNGFTILKRVEGYK